MKKHLLLICMALLGLCASAQEAGKMGVGLNLSVAPCLEKNGPTNFDLGAKFQYNITDPIRLEAVLDYGFRSDGFDVFTIGVNGHYLFKLTEKFNFYPIAGFGYGHVGFKTPFMAGSYTEGANRFYFNLGLGGEYNINDNFAVDLELKYQYLKNYQRLPITLGVTYRF